jgi:hypothetical protein
VDLSRDLVGQHLTFASLECLKRRPCNLLGRTFRRVEIAGEVCVDEAGMAMPALLTSRLTSVVALAAAAASSSLVTSSFSGTTPSRVIASGLRAAA